MAETNDLLVYGGKILNSQPPLDIVAFTIKGGRINQVFTDPIAFENFSKTVSLPTLNLQGKVVVPGQIDGHTLTALVSRFGRLTSLAAATTLEAAAERIKTAIDEAETRIVQLTGWNAAALPLSRAELDKISPNRPVIVLNASLHGAVANTQALQAMKLSGTLLKHPADVDLQTGILRARAFEDFLKDFRPDQNATQANILTYADQLVAGGVVMAHDLCVQHPEQLAAYRTLAEAGKLPIPFRLYVTDVELLKHIPAHSKAGVPIMGLKIFLDGSYGMKTAAQDTTHRYPDGSRGLALMDVAGIVKAARDAIDNGAHHLVAHCIGSAACATFVEAAGKLRESIHTKNMVLRAAHFQTADDRTLQLARERGIYVCAQPNFSEDVVTYADRIAVPAHVNPLAAMALHLKEHFSFGTDSLPQTGLLYTAKWAIYPPMPHQKVGTSLHEVLPYMTRHVARMTGDQANLGAFVPGQLASFVVLEKLPQTKDDYDAPLVLETWIGGRKVYERKAVKAA